MAEQMQIDFLQLLQAGKKEEKVESKPVEVKESKEVKTKEKKDPAVKDKKVVPEKKKEEKIEKYEYPFSLYTEGSIVDISNYGFEDGKEYTDKEITKAMLRHRHYEFGGEMTYSMIKEDNTLVATAKQYKKG